MGRLLPLLSPSRRQTMNRDLGFDRETGKYVRPPLPTVLCSLPCLSHRQRAVCPAADANTHQKGIVKKAQRHLPWQLRLKMHRPRCQLQHRDQKL